MRSKGTAIPSQGQTPRYYRSYGKKGGAMLSAEEKRNLLIAMGTLTLCLTMVFRAGGANMLSELSTNPNTVLFTAVIAAVATTTGFAMHELAHKFVAQRYGCWAEFRYSMQGLFIALVTGFMGFLFAAPGAVYIAGAVDERQNGIISIAGPATNVLVVLALLPVLVLGLGGDAVLYGLGIVVYFNAFLAVFNMIPVMPLDGAKVLRWNVGIYIGAMALMVALLVFVYFNR